MNSLAANHVLLLTCILTAVSQPCRSCKNVLRLFKHGLFQVGWIVAFVGLCIANVSVNPISWWIVVYELALVIFVCSVLGTGKMTTYRLVVSERAQSGGSSLSLLFTLMHDYPSSGDRFGGNQCSLCNRWSVSIHCNSPSCAFCSIGRIYCHSCFSGKSVKIACM